MRRLTQKAPWPAALEQLVASTTYRPGWTVELFEDVDRDFEPGDAGRDRCIGHGTTLVVTTDTVNSYRPEQRIRVAHYFIVPAATYDERSWRRWLFEQLVKVELHECMEFFAIDGERPYAPSHGPGNDPYLVREVGSDLDRRTSFRGTVNE